MEGMRGAARRGRGKQNRGRSLWDASQVCRKTCKTGKGSEGKLARQRSRKPIYCSHLRRDMAGPRSALRHLRRPRESRNLGRRLAGRERWPSSPPRTSQRRRRDESLSRQRSPFPSFVARRRAKETLCIIRCGSRHDLRPPPPPPPSPARGARMDGQTEPRPRLAAASGSSHKALSSGDGFTALAKGSELVKPRLPWIFFFFLRRLIPTLNFKTSTCRDL